MAHLTGDRVLEVLRAAESGELIVVSRLATELAIKLDREAHTLYYDLFWKLCDLLKRGSVEFVGDSRNWRDGAVRIAV